MSSSRPLVLAVLFLLVPLGGTLLALLSPGTIGVAERGFSETVDHAGTLGLIVALMLQVLIAASGLLPASLVGIAAGALYGVGLGFALAAVSTLIGAWLTFRVSRSFFRDAVARLLPARPRLNNLDALVARDGWRLVCLLRVSPVMPFAATSYALGLTSIATGAYVGGTLASLPALFGYVILGSFADAMTAAWTEGLGAAHMALLGAGVLATGLLTWRMGHLVWRALHALDVVTPARV